jgi:hypothetical protein
MLGIADAGLAAQLDSFATGLADMVAAKNTALKDSLS